MNLEVRSGLKPIQNSEIPYAITTDQAEEFIQNKINVTVKTMNNNNIHQSDVDLRLLSSKVSRRYVPFIALFPLSILQNDRTGKRNEHELSIFNPQMTERAIKVKKPFFDLISCYIYNNDDERLFKDPKWRQTLGISAKTSSFLRNNRTPKVQSFNNGQNEFVVCLLDPVRVFHDMLTSKANNDRKRFFVEIGKTEQINGSIFRYEVYRIENRGKKKDNYSMEAMIAKELSSRMTR